VTTYATAGRHDPARTSDPGPPRHGRVRRSGFLARAPQDVPATIRNYLFLFVVVLISSFPLYWMFVIATSGDSALAQFPPAVIPGDQFTINLREVFTSQDVYFTASLINSFIVSSVVTVSVLLFCSLAGFAFAKLRFRGRHALMVIIVLTLMVPNQLGVVALYILMGKLGWNGTPLAVIVPGLVTAFGVFYMRQFIVGTVPNALVESARMDGANTLRIYWSVVLPAVRPALAVLGLLTFMTTWNDFQWPLITLGGSDYPTSMVALSDLASGTYVLYRRVLAGAFVATIPLLVMLFIGGRQIVRGIMEGAIKR
jgi:cellobiose transport system permease protein